MKILIADDHVTVREGLRMILDAQPDMEVVGSVDDGRQAVAEIERLSPDVVLMDISMPGLNGRAATMQVAERWPSVKVLTLTRHGDGSYLQQMLQAGAAGYVLKQSPPSELCRAIRTVASGQQYIDPALARGGDPQRTAPVSARPSAPLSPREVEVLRMIAWGHTNKEIAARLNLSVKTVEAHKANGMRKLDMKGRIDIVRYALLHNWLNES